MTLAVHTVSIEAAETLAAIRRAAGVVPDWTAESLVQLLGQEMVHGLVASRHDAPVGYVLFSLIAGEAEIYDISVALTAQRTGVGRELMAKMLSLLRVANAEVLHLEVAVDNLSAIALYEGFGFNKTGLRPRYYVRNEGIALDALIMSLVL